MKNYLIIALFSLSSIQLFSQQHGIEFSYTNSLFYGNNSSFLEECFRFDNFDTCLPVTEINLELNFKFNLDYSYQLRPKTQLLFGGGLDLWNYEIIDNIINTALPSNSNITASSKRGQFLANLFQLNVGFRNHLMLSEKLSAYLQNKIILGSGLILEDEYNHLALQPALGIQHKLGENFHLLFSIIYTKYLRRPLSGEPIHRTTLQDPQSIGLSVGIAKKL